MMTTPFVAPLDAKLVRYGFQMVDPPVTRVVAHPFEGFFMDAHELNSVTYDTIDQPNLVNRWRLFAGQLARGYENRYRVFAQYIQLRRPLIHRRHPTTMAVRLTRFK